jgi:dolichol-phosphate mannosyltransferase
MQYHILFTRPKNNKYALGVFVLNEGERFIQQLKQMNNQVMKCDVVVVDGGSTDGSVNKAMLEALNVNTCLIKDEDGGLGTQMRIFFEWALKKGYEGVVVMDGNGKDGLDVIDNITAELNEGFDHIQGSRFVEGGEHKNTPLSRLVGLRLLHAPLISFASGIKQTDTTNGCRGYSSKLLTSGKLSIFRSVFTGYELHYYIAVNAPKLGFRCTEVPAKRYYPETGKIPTKISPLRGNLKVLFLLLKVVVGGFRVK